MSLLIDDCIANGKDYNDGGARYNSSYIQGVGMGTITDSLTAIKYHVYDRRPWHGDFLKALSDNFDGADEFRHQLMAQTPKYGNDDDYADSLLRRVFESYFSMIDVAPIPRRPSPHQFAADHLSHLFRERGWGDTRRSHERRAAF